MDASQLSSAEHQALVVLAAAHCTVPHPRPCRRSAMTTRNGDLAHREMLTIQWKVADWLTERGYVRVTNDVVRTLELTDTGRALAIEAGL